MALIANHGCRGFSSPSICKKTAAPQEVSKWQLQTEPRLMSSMMAMSRWITQEDWFSALCFPTMLLDTTTPLPRHELTARARIPLSSIQAPWALPLPAHLIAARVTEAFMWWRLTMIREHPLCGSPMTPAAPLTSAMARATPPLR